MSKGNCWLFFIFGLALLLTAMAPPANAQATAAANIEGTVTDPSGASVAGVQVVAKSKATDLTRATITSRQRILSL